MTRSALILAPLLLSACTYGAGAPMPLPPLSDDQAAPGLALVEHALTEHFARVPAGVDAPTICASLNARPFEASQEQALVARFPRLAPLARCIANGSGHVDAITGEPAELVRVEAFTCDSVTACSGWVTYPGQAGLRYAMRWTMGGWRFVQEAAPAP